MKKRKKRKHRKRHPNSDDHTSDTESASTNEESTDDKSSGKTPQSTCNTTPPSVSTNIESVRSHVCCHEHHSVRPVREHYTHKRKRHRTSHRSEKGPSLLDSLLEGTENSDAESVVDLDEKGPKDNEEKGPMDHKEKGPFTEVGQYQPTHPQYVPDEVSTKPPHMCMPHTKHTHIS